MLTATKHNIPRESKQQAERKRNETIFLFTNINASYRFCHCCKSLILLLQVADVTAAAAADFVVAALFWGARFRGRYNRPKRIRGRRYASMKSELELELELKISGTGKQSCPVRRRPIGSWLGLWCCRSLLESVAAQWATIRNKKLAHGTRRSII